jgi:hypothetical protein
MSFVYGSGRYSCGSRVSGGDGGHAQFVAAVLGGLATDAAIPTTRLNLVRSRSSTVCVRAGLETTGLLRKGVMIAVATEEEQSRVWPERSNRRRAGPLRVPQRATLKMSVSTHIFRCNMDPFRCRNGRSS